MKRVFLDNCKTTRTFNEVVEEMTPYFTDKFHFPSNFISVGTDASERIDNWKEIVANSINASPKEIHFTSSGTIANNIAIKGLILNNANKGSHIICSVIDYPDILTNLSFFENSGFEVTFLPANWEGIVEPEELEKAIRPDTILFISTFVNHTVGTIQPIKKYKQILNKADHKILFHVDAAQAYGKIKFDIKDLEVDSLSISGHKIHGPQGVGALFVKNSVNLALMQHGINRIDKYNTGAVSIANIAGFCKAIELTFENFEKNVKYIESLRDYLYESIVKNIPEILLNGSKKYRACHNLNITFNYIEGEAIMMMLDMFGITVATGSACASQGLKANYIMMAMGRTHEQSHGSIKFTLSRFNTKEEINYTVEKLTEIVKKLRENSPLNN